LEDGSFLEVLASLFLELLLSELLALGLALLDLEFFNAGLLLF
jgi:hypothetical protein